MGHLNYYGAVKVTQDLSLILQNYIEKEKQDTANYAALNSDYNKFTRVVNANEIMTEKDVEAYLNKAFADDAYSLFIINNGEKLNEDVFEILKANNVTLPLDEEKFTISVNVNGENLTDTHNLNFDLFGEDGNVAYDFIENDAQIYLNETAVMSQQSNFKIVLYDNILQRPLETVALENGYLKHKEFTSDIINLYKK